MRAPHAQEVSYEVPAIPIVAAAFVTTSVIYLLIRKWRRKRRGKAPTSNAEEALT